MNALIGKVCSSCSNMEEVTADCRRGSNLVKWSGKVDLSGAY